MILLRTIRPLTSAFDLPEVKLPITMDNKWSEPLVLIWERERDEHPL